MIPLVIFWLSGCAALGNLLFLEASKRPLPQWAWWTLPAAGLAAAAPLWIVRCRGRSVLSEALTSMGAALGLALSFLPSLYAALPTVPADSLGIWMYRWGLVLFVILLGMSVHDSGRVAALLRFAGYLRRLAGGFNPLDLQTAALRKFSRSRLAPEHWRAIAEGFDPIYRGRFHGDVEAFLAAFEASRKGRLWPWETFRK